MIKKKLLILNYFLLQICFLSFVSYNYIFNVYQDYRVSTETILVVIYAVVFVDMYLFVEYIRLFSKEKEVEKVTLLLNDANNLIYSVQARHHDFINHLQVIMGLGQLGSYEEVDAYIKNLSRELIEYEKLVSLKRPEVAALISSRVAGLSYLRANLDITTTLEGIEISPIHLISILGNLLDNAIDEISSKDDKWIEIKIYEDGGYFVFQITNPGEIPEEIRGKIFDLGVTTKSEEDRGMGLYATQKLVKNCGGILAVDFSKEKQVTFIVKLPKCGGFTKDSMKNWVRA